MPNGRVRPRPLTEGMEVESGELAAGWPSKLSGPAQQLQQEAGPQQQPHGTLACGVGVLDGPEGARSRCAREEGASARCECGRHTFLLSSPSAGPREQKGDENRPPAQAQQGQQQSGHPEDIENISRSMVQAMARGDKSVHEGAAASASSSSEQQQQHQQQQPSAQGHGKRPSLSISGSGRGGSGSELPLDRIVVEPNGDMVLVEPSVVCDACPACDDVCGLAACRGCTEKRARLLARGDMCLLDAHGRRLIRESSSAGGGSGPAGCVPRIGKPRTPSGAAASGAGSSPATACYTLCEIRRHRTLASCWLVAKGQVYDATRYLSSHPAGAIAIARKAGGVDCSEDLEFHSGRAQRLWKHLRIGTVVACPSEALKPAQLAPGPALGRRGSRSHRHSHHQWREEAGTASSLVGSSCSIM